MAGAATNSKARGPRVTVLVGQIKKKVNGKDSNVNAYSYMAKTTAEYFGFKIEASATTTPSSKGGGKKASPRLVRGSSGAGSIQVPKSGQGSQKGFVRIPIPSGLTIIQIKAFLGKASKNKPTYFVSKGGRTYPIADTKGGAK